MEITLKAARINKGLTQKEAGSRLDVDVATIRNWEKGRTFPDVMQIKKIECVYDVSYDNLIFLPVTSE